MTKSFWAVPVLFLASSLFTACSSSTPNAINPISGPTISVQTDLDPFVEVPTPTPAPIATATPVGSVNPTESLNSEEDEDPSESQSSLRQRMAVPTEEPESEPDDRYPVLCQSGSPCVFDDADVDSIELDSQGILVPRVELAVDVTYVPGCETLLPAQVSQQGRTIAVTIPLLRDPGVCAVILAVPQIRTIDVNLGTLRRGEYELTINGETQTVRVPVRN